MIVESFDAAQLMTAECLCFRSRRAMRLITRAYDEALRPLGLQATQLTLLNAVAMGGPRGNTMPRLSDVLAMDLSTLSRNLKPLERDGAIEIHRAADDRRVRVATLTAKGRELIAAALPLWQTAHQQVMDALGHSAAVDLRDQLNEVARRLNLSGDHATVSGRGVGK